jgi:hypothetical protein
MLGVSKASRLTLFVDASVESAEVSEEVDADQD